MSFETIKYKKTKRGKLGYRYLVHSERRGDKVVQVIDKYLGPVKPSKGRVKDKSAVSGNTLTKIKVVGGGVVKTAIVSYKTASGEKKELQISYDKSPLSTTGKLIDPRITVWMEFNKDKGQYDKKIFNGVYMRESARKFVKKTYGIDIGDIKF